MGRECYTRNGTLITSAAYQSCSNDTSHDSTCCGINHQGAGDTQVADDVCESNGLCQNYEAYDGTNAGVKAWARQGCTDPTWESPYCLKDVCNFDLWQVDNAAVQKCGDNSWCCGGKSCCSVSSSLFILAATVGPTSTATSKLSSSTSPASTSASVTMSSTASNGGVASPTTSLSSTLDSSTKGLSTTARAGIGGGIAVVIVLLGIVAFLGIKLRKRKQKREQDLADVLHYAGQGKHQSTVYVREVSPAELDGGSAPVELGERGATELSCGRQVAELPGRNSVFVGRGV